MKRKLILLTACAVALALVLAAAAVLYDRLSDRQRLEQVAQLPLYTPATQASPDTETTTDATEATRAMAPNFTVYDAAGTPHTLEEFRGKPVVLNFWASWCGPCKAEMPIFQQAYDVYKDEVYFLMINMTDGMRETQQSAEEYIAGQGYRFPVYFDSDSAGAIAYNVQSVPSTYFIDAEGRPVAYATGQLSGTSLEKGISMCR